MDNREIRAFITEFETRAEGEDVGIIKGRPIVFDSETNMGWYREIIDRHALDNADLRDVRLCLNHDTSYVYARSRNNNDNSTMRIGVDEGGMYFEARLDLKSAKANDLYVAVQRGDLNQMSFMFVVSADEWEDIDSDSPLRIVKEIRTVYEISVVTFPAYESTEISARDKEALDSAKATLESVRSQALESDVEALELEKAKLRNKFF